MTTYGEVSWDDNSGSSGSADKGGNDTWLRLEDGSNKVRIVTLPQQYIVHGGIKREGDKGFGQKVSCSKVNGSCPLCEMGYDTSTRWFLGVIDRKSNSYRVLDVGPSIYYDLKALHNGNWPNPKSYDLDLIKNSKTRDPKHFYTVQPIERFPLSAADQKIVDEQMDMEFLQRKITPPTAEQVQKRLDKILEGGASLVAPVKKEKSVKKVAEKGAASAAPKSVAAPVVGGDDELDNLFPAYDAEATNS